MVRYYGWYSNKSRGLRLKNDLQKIGIKPENRNDIQVIDVSKYQPKKVPSLTWLECIKKIWNDDPLICPECLSEMRIISFITEPQTIREILKYLNLWDEKSATTFQPDVGEFLCTTTTFAGESVPI